MSTPKTIVLAYSGGLDTSTIIPWLLENESPCGIVAVCIDLGQRELATPQAKQAVINRALEYGAAHCEIVDAVSTFVTDYCWPTMQAGAIYEGQYLLGTSMARPLIGKILVDIAKRENATAICHGATGKGNDQVRFELAIKAWGPHLAIIAPWRRWHIQSREDAMAYLEERQLPVPMKKEQSYSRDENLWHLSHEGLELESPANAPDYNRLLQLCVPPQQAPDHAETLALHFEQGLPTHLNGKALDAVAMLQQLNTLAGSHGVGIVDLVENRLVGLKSRGVYETPGGTVLYRAHQALESVCLDRQTVQYKTQVALKLAELIYNGEWFSPLREALMAFVAHTQQTVTGEVQVQLYKGNIIVQSVQSPYSLYSESLASFTTGALYSHADAEGFINLFGLPTKTRALLQQTLHKAV